jgi:hypothetical protein
MDITRALIEDISGCAVLPGRVTVTAQGSLGFDLPSHDHVLMQDDPGQGIMFSAVTAARPLDNGFCNVMRHGPRFLLWGINSRDIDSRVRNYRINLKKTEDSCTTAYRLMADTRSQSFSQIEITGTYTQDGLQLFIAGSVADGDSPLCDAYRIEVLLSWETLILLGWQAAAPYHKYDPEGPAYPTRDDYPDRERDPRHLHDLMIEQGFGSPIIPGSCELERSTSAALERRPSGTRVGEFVRMRMGHRENGISIAKAYRVEILDNGFARGRVESQAINLNRFGIDWLEESLTFRSSVSVTASGDMLGSVFWETGQGAERWHAENHITQSINHLKMRAELTAYGLEMTAEGTLAAFDPADRKRPEIRDRILPFTAFHLSLSMPWALLVLKRLGFAKKIRDF